MLFSVTPGLLFLVTPGLFSVTPEPGNVLGCTERRERGDNSLRQLGSQRSSVCPSCPTLPVSFGNRPAPRHPQAEPLPCPVWGSHSEQTPIAPSSGVSSFPQSWDRVDSAGSLPGCCAVRRVRRAVPSASPGSSFSLREGCAPPLQGGRRHVHPFEVRVAT